MKKYLESKIEDRQQFLLKNEKERMTALAEKRAYEDMLQHWMSESGVLSNAPDDAFKPAGFELSHEWTTIMGKLSGTGRSFSAGDMVRVGQEAGYTTKTPNARSQLAFYSTKGYVRRVRRGRYTITEKGQAAFNKKAPTEPSEGASKITGEAATSPIETPDFMATVADLE